MLKIFLARHGEDEDNANGILNGHRDLPLTSKGKKQAKELANKIKEKGLAFDKIYCSPLLRAKETAKIIAKKINLDKPEVLEELIERDFGVMTGVSTNKIEALCAPDILKTGTITYFMHAKGAETFDQVKKRAKKLLSFIRKKHHHGNILLVGHGDMGKMIFAAYFDIPWKEALTLFHFGNSQLLELSEKRPTLSTVHEVTN